MAKMKDLNDLLSHELKELYLAEKKLITGLTQLVKKADTGLRKTLDELLAISNQQKTRLDKVKELLKGEDAPAGGKKKISATTNTDSSSRKKISEAGNVAGTTRGKKAAPRRPSANVESPGGRAGTSHRPNRGR